MPGAARRIAVYAASDGLIIRPLASKEQRPSSPIKIRYGEGTISTEYRDNHSLLEQNGASSKFEAFGVVGLFRVSDLGYLVTIVRRQYVAQIFGNPIYAVTEVAITPCSSQSDAGQSIACTAAGLQIHPLHKNSEPVEIFGEAQEEEEDNDDDKEQELGQFSEGSEDIDETTPPNESTSHRSKRASIAEDVFHRKGSYGRFAQRWFSQSGWDLDHKRAMGMSISAATPSEDAKVDANLVASHAEQTLPGSSTDRKQVVSALLPKLLRAVSILFGTSRSFYFSYDINLTRRLAEGSWLFRHDQPLHAQVDAAYFWNRHILQPFLSAGQDSLALPLVQGFVDQRTFNVENDQLQFDEQSPESVELRAISEKVSANSKGSTEHGQTPFLVTLISRRSVRRAGLRYLRRGINEDGFTANSVETEQILSSPTWDPSSPIRSFLQIRGSIPLFFAQSAYAIRPVPILQHSQETNLKALKNHLVELRSKYGSIQIVNLVEKHWIEEPIGSLYQQLIEHVNNEDFAQSPISFEWFDFHQVCRGMKFENVNELLLKLEPTLDDCGSTIWNYGHLVHQQKGVIRTNCMDCLDRTNVCQSSFAKHMLERQLEEASVDLGALLDQEWAWFNTLWEDNGDAISKQYASTAAMKGDFTRTKKRDYRGALNYFGLSLARYYNGMVNDYFGQAAIDFLLGNVTVKVFDEFESEMMTKDPAVSLPRMRERAIELAQQRTIADAREELHCGWVLISPCATGVIRSRPMEEVVLTDAALYLCRLDWNLDKVSSFERVHLSNLNRIIFGTYITSTVSSAYTDETRNVGFVVEYESGKSNFRRTNTRTFSTQAEILPAAEPENAEKADRRPGFVDLFASKPEMSGSRKMVFKALYAESSDVVSGTGSRQTEMQQVAFICGEIERLARNQKSRQDSPVTLEKGDIISMEAAKRNTELLEQLGHSIKKLVWA